MKIKLNIKSIILMTAIVLASMLFINISFAADTGKVTVETDQGPVHRTTVNTNSSTTSSNNNDNSKLWGCCICLIFIFIIFAIFGH